MIPVLNIDGAFLTSYTKIMVEKDERLLKRYYTLSKKLLLETAMMLMDIDYIMVDGTYMQKVAF